MNKQFLLTLASAFGLSLIVVKAVRWMFGISLPGYMLWRLWLLDWFTS